MTSLKNAYPQVGQSAQQVSTSTPQTSSHKPLSLSYDDPVIAVFLRILAWERYVAEKPKISSKEAVTQHIKQARRELGITPYVKRSESGGADDYLQKLRGREFITATNDHLPKTHAGWRSEWRLHNLPPHDLVRQLSFDPVCKPPSIEDKAKDPYVNWLVTLRNPAVLPMRVYVGKRVGTGFPDRRGLYFLGLPEGLYVGETDEFGVRLKSHINDKRRPKNVLWYVFVSPDDVEGIFTQDALKAAEGLLISLANEVSVITNDKRGKDRKPAAIYLQQAVLAVMGGWAVFLWLAREHRDICLNRKKDKLKLATYFPMPISTPLSKSSSAGANQSSTGTNIRKSQDLLFYPKSSGIRQWPDCYLDQPYL